MFELSALKDDIVYGNVTQKMHKLQSDSSPAMNSSTPSNMDPGAAELPVYGNVDEFKVLKTTKGLQSMSDINILLLVSSAEHHLSSFHQYYCT